MQHHCKWQTTAHGKNTGEKWKGYGDGGNIYAGLKNDSWCSTCSPQHDNNSLSSIMLLFYDKAHLHMITQGPFRWKKCKKHTETLEKVGGLDDDVRAWILKGTFILAVRVLQVSSVFKRQINDSTTQLSAEYTCARFSMIYCSISSTMANLPNKIARVEWIELM